MTCECNIVRDLLPLYVEGLTSQDSTQFVEAHLRNCPECRLVCQQMKIPEIPVDQAPELPLKVVKRKMMTRRLRTVAITAVFALALLVTAFGALDAPEYFPYSPDLLTITENEGGGITITFDAQVTDYRLVEAGGEGNWELEAWSSAWDRWQADRGNQSVTLPAREGALRVYYVQNNGVDSDVCIYGQPDAEGAGRITLPRLTLGYYLLLAVGAGTLLLALCVALRRHPRFQRWTQGALLYPICYVAGHVAVLGFKTTSYSLPRDFFWILLVSLLLYGAALLGLSSYRLRIEEV